VHSQIVEISTPGRYLSVHRGFLRVLEQQIEIARLPLDDISAILVTTPGASLSTALATDLASRGTPLVVCGTNFRPVAILWPVDQHYEQAKRFQWQISLSRPRKKNLWQQLVRQKVLNQSAVLARWDSALAILPRLAKQVRSGDPSNIEAQAARYYWSALFGDEFRRDIDGGGINAQLNYGYAVLRAAVARAVVAVGLHPSLGIFHSDPRNSFQLVDDLMEPFRPLVDCYVRGLGREDSVSSAAKRGLAALLEQVCEIEGESCVFSQALHRYIRSYVDVIRGEKMAFVFPDIMYGN
jgi:CRISPR-associated protein Cas1